MLQQIRQDEKESKETWAVGYHQLAELINVNSLKTGVEVGVAYGGQSEYLMEKTSLERLIGVDAYMSYDSYDDPMKKNQSYHDELFKYVGTKLSSHGDRYRLIRGFSAEVANELTDLQDFVYLDGDHSYQGVLTDLRSWWPRVKDGGFICGDDIGHDAFPGVQKAVNQFFDRWNDKVTVTSDGFWYLRKDPVKNVVSFYIPAYNAEKTIADAIESIVEGNLRPGDELIVVNDCSTDNTSSILDSYEKKYPDTLKVIHHLQNLGGGAARNTAIAEAKHALVFNLDSDNLLVPGSVDLLRERILQGDCDAACFEGTDFFLAENGSRSHFTKYGFPTYSINNYFSSTNVPGMGGNYLFFKHCWRKSGGFPTTLGAIDTYSFGANFVMAGYCYSVVPDSYYRHRYGNESYWVTSSGIASFRALSVLLPYLHGFDRKTQNYLLSKKGRYNWYKDLDSRPLTVKPNFFDASNDVRFESSFHWFRENSLFRSVYNLLPEFLRKLLRGT